MIRFLPASLALASLTLAALLATPALADQPRIHPTDDVAVTYKVLDSTRAAGQGEPREVRMFWTDHGNMVRIDAGGPMGWAIINFARRQMTVVMAAQHRYIQMPLDPNRTPGLFSMPPDTVATRAGRDTVAGQACTVWNVTSPKGKGTACIASDGLLLSVKGHGSEVEEGHRVSGDGGLLATSVTYGPQSAALFAPPAGFQALSIPHMPPGPGGAPGSRQP